MKEQRKDPPATAAPLRRFLRRPEVCDRTGLKTSTLYERIAAREFPAPLKISKRIAVWLEEDVAAWQAARIAERDNSK